MYRARIYLAHTECASSLCCPQCSSEEVWEKPKYYQEYPQIHAKALTMQRKCMFHTSICVWNGWQCCEMSKLVSVQKVRLILQIYLTTTKGKWQLKPAVQPLVVNGAVQTAHLAAPALSLMLYLQSNVTDQLFWINNICMRVCIIHTQEGKLELIKLKQHLYIW